MLAYQLWPGGRKEDKVEGKERGREGPTLRSERRGWLKGEKERCPFKADMQRGGWRPKAGLRGQRSFLFCSCLFLWMRPVEGLRPTGQVAA